MPERKLNDSPAPTMVRIEVASERLGHQTIGITLDVYSHVMPGVQADAAHQVDATIRRAVKAGE